MRILVRSRIGNGVLGILGVIYVCAAIALLAYELVQTWGATSLTDDAVIVVLVASAGAGALFIVTAVQNLGLRPTRREAQPHREGAAAVP